jgi:hypothetical protein
MQRRQPRRLGIVPHLILLLLPSLRSCHDCMRASLVGWMIQKCSNVVHKQRIQKLCNLFLVRKIQSALEWDPGTKLAHGRDKLAHPTYQTPLRCIGPIFTTCLIFSLLRIPSLRPRVIPATFNSLVPFIIWLSAKMSQFEILQKRVSLLTLASGNTDSLGFDLETQAALVFPQSGSHSWLHPGRSNLAGSIKALLLPIPPLTRHARLTRCHCW